VRYLNIQVAVVMDISPLYQKHPHYISLHWYKFLNSTCY